MNNTLKIGVCACLVLGLSWQSSEAKTKQEFLVNKSKSDISKKQLGKFPFYVYREKSDVLQYVPSGWMGDYKDLRVNDKYTKDAHSGKTSVQIIYSAERKNGNGWTGIFWQYPPNNWGNKTLRPVELKKVDLSGAKRFVFWARGLKGDEVISEFKIGGINGAEAEGDSDSTSIGPITLTKKWKRYEIDLEGLDLSYIIGGFAFAATADENPDGFTILLDDLYYE